MNHYGKGRFPPDHSVTFRPPPCVIGEEKRQLPPRRTKTSHGRRLPMACSHTAPDRDPERLVRAYADLVLRVCYTYLRSTADAEDVCQDTLLKLLLREEPFRDTGHERAWVIRVAINACKNLPRDCGGQGPAPHAASRGGIEPRAASLARRAPPTCGAQSPWPRVQGRLEAGREKTPVRCRHRTGVFDAWQEALRIRRSPGRAGPGRRGRRRRGPRRR